MRRCTGSDLFGINRYHQSLPITSLPLKTFIIILSYYNHVMIKMSSYLSNINTILNDHPTALPSSWFLLFTVSPLYCHRDNAYYHFLSFKIPYYPLSHFHIISILSSAQWYFSHSFKLIRYTTFLIISTWILSDVTRK